MKKKIWVLMILAMLFVVGCGKRNEKTIDNSSGSDEIVVDSNMTVENVGNENQEDKPVVDIPDVEYEEWLTDDAGNKLFGYNLPLGWTSKKGDKGKGHVSVELFEYGSEQQWGDITIHCSKGDDWMGWYETEISPDYMQDSGVTYSLEKTIKTVYGNCKMFYGRTNEENLAESIYSLIKLNDDWCVCFVSHATSYGLDVTGSFLEDYIHIIMGEKQTALNIEYDYVNYLVDKNGNRLMGFNTPIGMNRVEDDPAVRMQNSNGSKTVRVLNTSCEYAYYMMSCSGNEYTERTFKGELETEYGTAKVYDVKLFGGTGDVSWSTYMEEALFCVNGVYIWVQYTDYNAKDYVNELEEIIKNQLFVQE